MSDAGRLSGESLAAGDPTGWFERLYAEAQDGTAVVPWDRAAPHPLLVDWTQARDLDGHGRRALIVGAGPGHDAEHVAGLGFATTAFDISPTAIAAARARFPDSPVDYRTADLLAPPAEWAGAFDLVVEIMTVQALPDPPRAAAIAQVPGLVAPGGTLLVVASATDPDGVYGSGPPWPLTRAEIEAFASDGVALLTAERIESWWRAELRRPRSQSGHDGGGVAQ